MQTHRTVILALIASLALIAQAHAATVPLSWQARALATTEHYWHTPPLRLSFDPPRNDLGVDVTSLGGWALPGVPVIHINAATRWLGYPDFCMTVIHEGGHVMGHPHSGNPRSIMYPAQDVGRFRSRVAGSRRTFIVWTGVARPCIPTSPQRRARR